MIRITSTQIPRFWEVIKFSALNSDQVDQKHQTTYCLNLLIDLLSERKQCYIVKDGSSISAIVIISFYIDKAIDVLGLHISNMYIFTKEGRKSISEIERDILKIAVETDSKIITIETSNKAAVKIISEAMSASKFKHSDKYTYLI